MQPLHKLKCAILLPTSTVGLCSSISWSYFMAGTTWSSAKMACAICTETGCWEWQCDKEKLMTFQSKVWFWHNSMAHIASCALELMHCSSWTSSLHDVGVFFMRFKLLTMFSVGFVCFMGWQSQVGSWLCSQVYFQICGDGSQTLFYLSWFLPRETCHSQLLRGLLQGWHRYLFLMLHGIPMYLPVRTLYFWEHLTTLSQTPSVPIPCFFTEKHAVSWCMVFYRDTIIPSWHSMECHCASCEAKIRPWQAITTKMLPPQHPPLQQRAPVPFQADSAGSSSYSTWKEP